MRLPFYPIVLIPLTHELSKSKSFCLTDYETILYCICFYPYASINTVAPKSGPCVEHQIGSQGVYWDYKVTNSPKFKQASSRLLLKSPRRAWLCQILRSTEAQHSDRMEQRTPGHCVGGLC